MQFSLRAWKKEEIQMCGYFSSYGFLLKTSVYAVDAVWISAQSILSILAFHEHADCGVMKQLPGALQGGASGAAGEPDLFCQGFVQNCDTNPALHGSTFCLIP